MVALDEQIGTKPEHKAKVINSLGSKVSNQKTGIRIEDEVSKVQEHKAVSGYRPRSVYTWAVKYLIRRQNVESKT